MQGLCVSSLGASFGPRVVLSQVDFQLAPTGITAMLGPAGTGKSTLLRTLAGLNQSNPRFRTWGQIQVVPVAGEKGRTEIRLVQQHVKLMRASTLDAMSDVLRRQTAFSPAALREHCAHQLQEHGFADLGQCLDLPVISLSPVQQRVVAILREAMAEPAVLLIDEPTADLQGYEAYLLLDLLRQLSARMAIVLVTHNLEHARAVARDVLLIAGGRIIESTPASEFFQDPQTTAGKQFMSSGSCFVASPGAKAEELADDVEPPPPLPPEALAAIAEFIEDSQPQTASTVAASGDAGMQEAAAPLLPPETAMALPVELAPLVEPPAVAASEPPAGEPVIADAKPQEPMAEPSDIRMAAPAPKPVKASVLLEWEPLKPVDNAAPASRGPTGFNWLVPGRLAGTPWPGVVQSVDTDLQALKRCGVTILITLTERDLPQEILRAHDLRNLHLPVYDREPPTVGQLQMLLARMSVMLRRGEVLAVHCLAGLGRTGTVLAAWLIREGLSAEEALRRLRLIDHQYVQSQAQEMLLHEYEQSLFAKTA